MARRWPPPCYETEDEVGLPHERQFTIACLVSTYREIGCGKSKKVAKRLAAQKMWQRLQNLPMEAQDENDDVSKCLLFILSCICMVVGALNRFNFFEPIFVFISIFYFNRIKID